MIEFTQTLKESLNNFRSCAQIYIWTAKSETLEKLQRKYHRTLEQMEEKVYSLYWCQQGFCCESEMLELKCKDTSLKY